MPSFTEFVDEVKGKVRIEEIVALTEPLVPHGKYWHGKRHDSLNVDVENGIFKWYSRGAEKGGDVFVWLQRYGGCADFISALRFCADYVGLAMPEFAAGEHDPARIAATRQRASALQLAIEFYQAELWKSQAALDYCHSRGWTDETLRYETVTQNAEGNFVVMARGCGLGFTGADGGNNWAVRDALRGTFSMYDIPLECPAAVAFIGYKGDVNKWWSKWSGECFADAPAQAWVDEGRIPGFPPNALVYPHYWRGRVVYAHGRGITEKRHHNPPAILLGEKPPYYNRSYTRMASHTIIVEGHADATTAHQWGWSSAALGSMDAVDALVDEVKDAKNYVALDNPRHDPHYAEQAEKLTGALADIEFKTIKLCEALGPLTRILTWPAKDANAWLVEQNPDQDKRLSLLRAAPTFVEWLAERAGQADPSEKDDAIMACIRQAAQLDDDKLSLKREVLVQLMGIKRTQFNGILKAVRANDAEDAAEEQDKPADEKPVIEVTGPLLVADGHFFDVLYDYEKDRLKLAVRYPNGDIASVDKVELDAVIYRASLLPDIYRACKKPMTPNAQPAILMPSEIAPELSIIQLNRMVFNFSQKYLDVDDTHRVIAGYWVILTWVSDCFREIGFLRAMGPSGKGKSRYVNTFGRLCYRVIRAAGRSTLSPMFRVKSQTHGTVIMDEINTAKTQIAPELEEFFRLGSSADSPPIWRTESDGRHAYPEPFGGAYCPKVFGAIKPFEDEGTNNRCITVDFILPTKRDDIPESLPEAFHHEAQEIRNHLMTFRMRHWQPWWEIKRERLDKNVDPRTRQIMAALVTLVDDAGTRANILEIMREQSSEMVDDRSASITSKCVRALALIMREPLNGGSQGRAYRDLRVSRIHQLVKDMVFDEEEAAPEFKTVHDKDTGDEKQVKDMDSPRNRDKHWFNQYFAPRRIGEIVRRQLGFKTGDATWHKSKPRAVLLDDADRPRLDELMALYGVTLEPEPAPAAPAVDAAPDEPLPPGMEEYLEGGDE